MNYYVLAITDVGPTFMSKVNQKTNNVEFNPKKAPMPMPRDVAESIVTQLTLTHHIKAFLVGSEALIKEHSDFLKQNPMPL